MRKRARATEESLAITLEEPDAKDRRARNAECAHRIALKDGRNEETTVVRSGYDRCSRNTSNISSDVVADCIVTRRHTHIPMYRRRILVATFRRRNGVLMMFPKKTVDVNKHLQP
jgi:hypothetical protein